MQSFISNAELLELLRENIHDLVAVIDSQRRRLWFNDAYSETLGFERAALESGDSTSSLHPDDIENVRRQFEEALASGQGKRLEYRMRHQNGSWIWLESRSRVIRDVPNVGTCVILVARDITLRKEAEARQRAHQQRIQAQKNALVELNRDPDLHQDQREALIRKVSELTRQTLNCDEVSVGWRENLPSQREIPTGPDIPRATVTPATSVAQVASSTRSSSDSIELARAWMESGAKPPPPAGTLPEAASGSLNVTLYRGGVAVGDMVCIHQHSPRAWEPDEVSFAESVGAVLMQSLEAREKRLAFVALESSQQRLAAELAEAAAYVQALLPPPQTTHPQVDWAFVPSTQLGGDAFGYHWIDPDHFAIYLLDVCGHGVGAALLSISALNLLRTGSLPSVNFRSPAAVMRRLNETFEMDRQNQMYFTLWYGVWNRPAGELRCCCSGHPPAQLFSPEPTNPPIRAGRSEPVVGVMPEVTYTETVVPVPVGSTLLVFSDGVYEILRPDGSVGTMEIFLGAARRLGIAQGEPLEGLIEFARAERGQSILEDDFSLVRIRF